MKRIAILMVTVLLGLSASASAVHYFTRSQAERAVNYLNRQNELMIYCGYDYEIETYVLINEIWAERINSAYYELWIYGFDAYTGDEIYMPLDLQCVWLYGAGRMYNAAQYLRFRTSVHTPQIRWYIPPYHPYTRIMHRPGYVRSYHYDIHRHGWMPPSHPAYHGQHHDPHHTPLPPYYDRTPQSPAPAPTTAWTPGVDHPQISSTPRTTSGGTTSTRSTTGTATETRSTGNTTGTRSTSGTATETRSTSGTTTGTRSTSGTTTSTRSTSSSTTGTRSTSGSTTGTRSAGTTETRSTSGTTTNTRSTNNTPTRANTGTSTRSTSTSTKSDSDKGSTRSTSATTTPRSNASGTIRSTTGSTTATGTRSTTGSTGNRSTTGTATPRNR